MQFGNSESSTSGNEAGQAGTAYRGRQRKDNREKGDEKNSNQQGVKARPGSKTKDQVQDHVGKPLIGHPSAGLACQKGIVKGNFLVLPDPLPGLQVPAQPRIINRAGQLPSQKGDGCRRDYEIGCSNTLNFHVIPKQSCFGRMM